MFRMVVIGCLVRPLQERDLPPYGGKLSPALMNKARTGG